MDLVLLNTIAPVAAVVGLAGASTIGTQIVTNAFTAQFYPLAIRSTGLGWALSWAS